MLAAHFRFRNFVSGESTRRARGVDRGGAWKVGDLVESRHGQGDGGDATRQEDVGRCEPIEPVTKDGSPPLLSKQWRNSIN